VFLVILKGIFFNNIPWDKLKIVPHHHQHQDEETRILDDEIMQLN
jgi:hypothetical protein